MITNVPQLRAALHQMASMVDMLEALQLDCQGKNDFSLFPLVSEGYLHQIRDLNIQIREYLGTDSLTESVDSGKRAVSAY
jgi:hypothetical protein